MSWELSLLITLVISILGSVWLRSSSPHSPLRNVLYVPVAACTLALAFDPDNLLQHYRNPHATLDNLLAFDFRPDALLLTHFKMVLTLGAVVWLLHRSWQTLWKPVPDLINILGVDVPEPPDVSLAGIRADAATLSWTRPPSNRPVQRYMIHVNGIHVGESLGHEVAITVTGLKPNHFYNIRVIAMGPNSFQAGSQVIRLRTFGRDGKPDLGGARLPTNFIDEDPSRSRGDNGDDSDAPTSSYAAVEAAPVLDGAPSSMRDISVTSPGQRRNTINRRHSPSVASMDQPSTRPPLPDGPDLSLDELNQRFEEIRREIEDTIAVYNKDEQEALLQEDELRKEKERKKLALKEKEEYTAQLKALVRTTMEQFRAAEKERLKKEQQLKDKEAKKSKVRDNISKLEQEIERMRNERESFQSQKKTLIEKRDADVDQLDDEINELQETCAELELDLKDKGKQLQDMKEAREKLPGAHDEQWKENDDRLRREWDILRQSLHAQLVAETKRSHQLDQAMHSLAEQQLVVQSAISSFYAQDASAADADMNAQAKRLSHGSNSMPHVNMSPPGHFANPDSTLTGLGHVGFAPGPYIDIHAARGGDSQSEADFKAAAGPLSPSAQDYLPSGILDYEGSDSRPSNSMLPESVTAGEEDPQSPMSSSRSFSILSSPHGSSYNLPFPTYADSNDGRSINLSPAPAPSRLTSLLSGWQRSKASKAVDDDGPPLGSLKTGQSQSFPRGFDESEPGNHRRRMSFSWKGHRNSTGPEGSLGQPAAGSKLTRNWLNPFYGLSNPAPSDRDPEMSRPPSIASAELPRPSTDSGSIWGTPGDGKSRMWSPNEHRWASRSGSRRPSLHGSPAMTTSLASAEDAILDKAEMRNPEALGVIGSRPPMSASAKSLTARLNPAAPIFGGTMPSFFRKDKDREHVPDKEKVKSKDKDRKDKAKDWKGKGKEVTTPSIELPRHSFDESPSDPRASRDTFSVHTQTSVSESHESLILDTTHSNTHADQGALSSSSNAREPENVNSIRKLLRKGSSGKFSLSSRLGKDSSLFKKGPGSTTNSDRNTSADHRSSIGDLDELGEDIAQLGRSYDSVASSPSLGPGKSKDAKEGRMSNWRFMMKKGKETPTREKESMEMDRSVDED